MADSRFTIVYKILKDYNFDSDNAISSDFLCTICTKILINAHIAPCRCRYCLECITAYLDGEDKYCPGNTDDCKIDLLNINNDIHTDHSMNIKISRLMVKCPEGQCDERVELRKMEDHIRVCNWKPTDCPFFNVGCRNVQMTNDKMEQHILSENHAHTKLLMDRIDNLSSEFGGIKEEMKGKQIVIDELRAVIAQQSREIGLLGEEMVALDHINRRLKDQINGLGTKMESYEMRNNAEERIDEINRLKRKGMNIDVKIGGLERVIAMAAKQKKMNHYGEFMWPIDNLSEKRRRARNGIDTEIFSEEFFTHKNGYKMCLSLWPDGCNIGKGTHLNIFIYLMRGPFDDILQWPFKHDVTIAIIDQQWNINHYSDTLKYEHLPNSQNWKKPTTERNIGCGYYNFIDLDQLLNDTSLYRNDRIFIKCIVHTS